MLALALAPGVASRAAALRLALLLACARAAAASEPSSSTAAPATPTLTSTPHWRLLIDRSNPPNADGEWINAEAYVYDIGFYNEHGDFLPHYAIDAVSTDCSLDEDGSRGPWLAVDDPAAQEACWATGPAESCWATCRDKRGKHIEVQFDSPRQVARLCVSQHSNALNAVPAFAVQWKGEPADGDPGAWTTAWT